MKPLRLLLPLAALLSSGCASAPVAKLAADYPKEQAEIRKRLNEVLDAAAKKDFVRLESYHSYDPKFTKFATEAPDRQDAEAACKGEHDGLSAARGLAMQAEGLKIDVFDDVGIATFVLNYSFKAGTSTIQKRARSTLVFVKDRSAWKIVHEHLSAYSPKP
jgi:ketosteroid isomerase-like protein